MFGDERFRLFTQSLARCLSPCLPPFQTLKSKRKRLSLLASWLMISSMALLQPMSAQAEPSSASQPTLHIYHLSPYIKQNTLFFDAQTRIRLPERIQQALLHEIPLTFDINIEVRQTDAFAGLSYPKTRYELSYQTELSYFNFNQKYLLMNRRNNKVKLFDQLQRALETLGTFEHFKVMPLQLDPIIPPPPITLRLRITLNRWQLPAPLALEALYSTDWDLDSGWVSVPISPPAPHLIGTVEK